jgi:hypothetical protein
MIPASFSNFFLAMAGAGAGLIGLLFVAISINPTRMLGSEGQPEHQVMAESTFSALVNGFFLSCAALIPAGGIGYVGMVFASLGLASTILLTLRLTRQPLSAPLPGRSRWARVIRIYLVNVFSLALYGYEFFICTQLIHPPLSEDRLIALCDVLLALYGVALVRAWELLGSRHGGFIGFLNPLIDLSPSPQEKAPEQAQTTQSAKAES